MCLPGQPPAVPASVTDALAMAEAGLSYLASDDAGSLPTAVQAECLRRLERMESVRTAARSSVLQAFHAQSGFEDDGQATAKSWLRWQARITAGAAGAATGWMRRLAAHPRVREALAAGTVSVSWARQICDWVRPLPEGNWAAAERILLAAAAEGAELADLASLAEELHSRCLPQGPDGEGDDGFADRSLRLDLHFRGAGRLEGDLTPGCAVALTAVLGALGKRSGPEDTRTRMQRDHDALEEACRRLVATGCLPDRAGQPTQIQLHMTLDQLLARHGQPGGGAATRGERGPVALPGPAAGPGLECDATIVPIVSAHVDAAALERLTAALRLRPRAAGPPGWHPPAGHPPPGEGAGGEAGDRDEQARARDLRAERAARKILLRHAVELLSGPSGLAGFLRRGLRGPAASVSLPLDIGAATETIPAHLRRAVMARDRRCRFPGCAQPAAACQPHHIVPRSEGGATSLGGLMLLCTFHHLIAVHRWGWRIWLHPDGTVTAVSPDGARILHSHPPDASAA